MGTATKKQFRVLALAVLLCILLAGCSGSTATVPAATSATGTSGTTGTTGSTGAETTYVPHGEVEWTYQYSSDAALAEEVEENGFLILKETVELDAAGRAEQIVTEAAIWADALYNSESLSGRATGSLQAEAALQAMENGLFAAACNTIELFAEDSDIITVTFDYQYSYEDSDEEQAAEPEAQAILDKATVTSSNNGHTVSVTYTRQADGTMAVQTSGSDAKSQIERILEFVASPSEPVSKTISSAEMTELVLEMGNNAWEDVQELVQEEGYTFETFPEQTELYEAGTQHIRALDNTWELYRYATRDELYLRKFDRQPDVEGVRFYADLYDSIEDSTGQTGTDCFRIQRVVGAEQDGMLAAVYITYGYGVAANDQAQYTIQAIGINGVPAAELDALLYANSFADLLALYRAYESVTLGYDDFVIQNNTLVRCDNSAQWCDETSTAADEDAGISIADEDLDDAWDDLDDLDAMMGVDADAAAPQDGSTDTGETDHTEQQEEEEPEPTRTTDPADFYYPYASTYGGNRIIMDQIWAALLRQSEPDDEMIGDYVLQAIDGAYASLEAAEIRAEEVFEGR
jgi:hypothetical protein